VPRQVKETGLGKRAPKFDEPSLRLLIRHYTREAGLRELERVIGAVCRKVALAIAEGKTPPKRVTAKLIDDYLGPPKHLPEEEHPEDQVGVALGLAWTAVGGEVLAVEALSTPGSGRLTLTGQLGDVMKESAQAAFSHARKIAESYGIDPKFYKNRDVHVHVPAGAVPKDGPSAGVTIATALTSALSDRPVSRDVAMTGEITLGGRVLPIGGLKEKALAAHRFGVHHLVIPKGNAKDIVDIPEPVREALEIHPVERIDEVLSLALTGSVPKRARTGRAAPRRKSAAKSKTAKSKTAKRKAAPAARRGAR